MKSKLLNALLLITSLFGYLEWGSNSSTFLFQAEAEIFSKIISDPVSVLHPFTVLPFLGQFLLFISLFQKQPNRILTYAGMAGIGILLLLMFFIGCMGLNYKIILATLPFLVVSYLTIRYRRAKMKTNGS